MPSDIPDREKQHPFSHYLIVAILVLVLGVTLGITCVDYSLAERNLQNRARLLEVQLEEGIVENLQIADEGLDLFDSTQNRRMQAGLERFVAGYESAGRDPTRMDLAALQREIGTDMDLYVINESGVIEYTTFAPDKGLDFRTVPYFYEYLSRIRQSEGFFPDRTVTEPATGILRKYAYASSPDHRYVFELGLQGAILDNPVSELDVSSYIQNLASINPYVRSVRIFDSRKRLIDDKSFTADPELDRTLDQVLRERRGLSIADPGTGVEIHYLFVDLKVPEYGSDVSRIVEITYDTGLIRRTLDDLILYHVLVASFALLLALVCAILLSRRLTRPIQAMVMHVDAIGMDHIGQGPAGKPAAARPDGSKGFVGKHRFWLSIFLAMVAILGLIVVGITATDYVKAQNDYFTTDELVQRATDQSLTQSVHLLDGCYNIFDDTLNSQMEQQFEVFFAEYERADRDVSRMDLERVKRDLGGTTDLYVINRSMVIEYTTFAPDLGMDFSKYPYSYAYFQTIIGKSGFYPDRIVHEVTTGQFRKFAYMPTPDHAYIFELGLSGELFTERRHRLDYRETANTIARRDPYVQRIRFFDTTMRMIDNYSFEPESETANALRRVIAERKSIEVASPDDGTAMRYLYVDLSDPHYASDMSWIIELTRNTTMIEAALSEVLFSHAIVAVAALLLSAAFALVLSQVLTRPMKTMVADADAIAKGDIAHPIAPTRGSEFTQLEGSITTMVKRLQETIRELQISEERYRAVVESQSELIARFLPEGSLLFVNEAYCTYFGMPCHDLVGTKFEANIPEEERAGVAGHLRSLTREHPSGSIEHRIVRHGGEIRWLQWNHSALLDREGHIVEYLAVGRDITERKIAESDALDAMKRLDAIINTMANPVFVKDREHRWVLLNDAYCRFMGYPREDLMEKSDFDFFPATEAEVFWRQDEAVFETGHLNVNQELFTTAGEGVRTIITRKTLYTDTSGEKYIVGVIADITDVKRAEEEIRRLNEELEERVAARTQELEAANRELESYSYSVSHDLRAPLRAIDGYSGILLHEYSSSLPPEARDYLEKVRTNTQQMSQLIDALLNFSRVGRSALSRQTVYPSLMVNGIWESLRPEYQGRTIELTVGSLPPCQADVSLITLVFLNLLSNALKFTRKRRIARITVGSLTKDGNTVYFVQDNGVGFDPQYVGKIFGVFQRLHRQDEYEGTGVGLAIVKRIVTRHGGRIWVESEPDQGTTFFFTFC